MEKALVFGPLLIVLVLFGLLIIGFFALIFKLISKSKNEDWTGEVIDKKTKQVSDYDTDEVSTNYYLVVKMAVGRDRNIALSPERWESFSIGDKIHKPKGKLYPEKV